MSRDYRLYLEDIKSSCLKIQRYTVGMNFENLRQDDRTYDAVIRNFEIIGEAARSMPAEIQQKHPEISWRAIAALRNIVAHEYFGIKDEIIWDIVSQKIPELLAQVQTILED
jgi:uncharacterized protein with HEPN domain